MHEGPSFKDKTKNSDINDFKEGKRIKDGTQIF